MKAYISILTRKLRTLECYKNLILTLTIRYKIRFMVDAYEKIFVGRGQPLNGSQSTQEG